MAGPNVMLVLFSLLLAHMHMTVLCDSGSSTACTAYAMWMETFNTSAVLADMKMVIGVDATLANQDDVLFYAACKMKNGATLQDITGIDLGECDEAPDSFDGCTNSPCDVDSQCNTFQSVCTFQRAMATLTTCPESYDSASHSAGMPSSEQEVVDMCARLQGGTATTGDHELCCGRPECPDLSSLECFAPNPASVGEDDDICLSESTLDLLVDLNEHLRTNDFALPLANSVSDFVWISQLGVLPDSPLGPDDVTLVLSSVTAQPTCDQVKEDADFVAALAASDFRIKACLDDYVGGSRRRLLEAQFALYASLEANTGGVAAASLGDSNADASAGTLWITHEDAAVVFGSDSDPSVASVMLSADGLQMSADSVVVQGNLGAQNFEVAGSDLSDTIVRMQMLVGVLEGQIDDIEIQLDSLVL